MNIFAIIKLNLSHLRDVGHIVEFGSLQGGSAIFLRLCGQASSSWHADYFI